MKLVNVNDLQGGEMLACPILTEDDQVLIGKGTVIKESYIEKFIELGIREVEIEDKMAIEVESKRILQMEVKNDCLSKVKDILERHSYNNNAQLVEINLAAEKVIQTILEDEQVVDKVYEIKERSADLYEHSVSVCSMATLSALKLELDQSSVHEISIASLLHDLGLRYMTVPYANIDIETLSKKEIEEYRKHTVYGYTAVQHEGWISEKAKQMILFHHERIDGSGYPLHAKEISKECQIIEVCEFLDEKLCGIGCKRMKVHEAIEYLKAISGSLFSKEIVDSVLTFTAVYPVGTTVKLSNGIVGIVVKQSEHFTDRPVIQVLTNQDGSNVEEKTLLDLVEIHNVVIDSVLD